VKTDYFKGTIIIPIEDFPTAIMAVTRQCFKALTGNNHQPRTAYLAKLFKAAV
jgi:hypothetical protein